MSGQSLLDVARVLKASRAVASKHLANRRHQLDAYNRTSSLTKAVRNQTERVTLTVRAASVLTERFNGRGVGYSTQSSQPRTPNQDTPVPSHAKFEGSPVKKKSTQTLDSDHSYERSKENTSKKPVQGNQIDIKQEQAKKPPSPDGSVPPASANLSEKYGKPKGDIDVSPNRTQTESTRRSKSQQDDQQIDRTRNDKGRRYSLTADQAKELQREAEKQIPSQAAEPPPVHSTNSATAEGNGTDSQRLHDGHEQVVFSSRSLNTAKVLSALPRVKIPRATEVVQESDSNVADEQMDQDVFYSSTSKLEDTALPSTQAVPEQAEPSEDMYSEMFHSSKAAKLIKGQPTPGQHSEGLNLKGAKDTANEGKKAPEERDHVSFSNRNISQTSRRAPEQVTTGETEPQQQSGEEDACKLAKKKARDAENAIEVLLSSD